MWFYRQSQSEIFVLMITNNNNNLKNIFEIKYMI